MRFVPQQMTFGWVERDLLRKCYECRHLTDYFDEYGQCKTCHVEHAVTCCMCDHETHIEHGHTHDEYDGTICDSCMSDNFYTCGDCEEVFENDTYGHHGENGTICRRCSNRNYFYCEGCNTHCHDNNYGSDSRCDDCCVPSQNDDDDNEYRDDDDLIEEYGHTTDMQFWGSPKDKLFLGVELEVEAHYGRRQPAQDTLNAFTSKFVVLKKDGSLHTGFEIVTAPASMDVQYQEWNRFFDTDVDDIQAESTCGMHVHASRKAITPLTLGKLIVFYNTDHNRDFITDIAGRNKIYSGSYDPNKKITDAKIGPYDQDREDRYTAVNTTNPATIEFRVFASTTKRDVFFARLEMVKACIDYCRTAGINDLTYEQFAYFVGQAPRVYPNLAKWMRDKGYLPKRGLMKCA